MPVTKRKRSSSRSRKKRSRSKYSLVRQPKINVLAPSSTIVKLKYCDIFTLKPATQGLAAYKQFSANGCYDPDLAVGGHQPLGWDQYCGFYNTYQVMSSTITVRFVDDYQDGFNQSIVSIGLESGVGDVNTSYSERMENNRVNWDVVDTTKQVVLRNSFDAYKYLGQPKEPYPTNSQPLNQASFSVMAFAPPSNNTSNIASVKCYLNITYTVKFTERINIGGS